MSAAFPLPSVWQFLAVTAAVAVPLAAIGYAAKCGRRAKVAVAAGFLLVAAYPFACGASQYAAGRGWLSSASGEAPGRLIFFVLDHGPFPIGSRHPYNDFERWCYWKGRHAQDASAP